MRVILFAVLVLLLLVGGSAVALFQFFGWKGLIAFPFVLLAVVWLGKIIIGKALKGLALGLFSMKSSALRGATLKLHSVTPVIKPPKRLMEAEAEESEASATGLENEEAFDADEPGDTEKDDEDLESDDDAKPRHYFAVDVTITPSAGDRVWEPGEFILSSEAVKSLEDLDEKQVGDAH